MHYDQIMESYTQLTPLTNYLSNCVIKLHIKLHTHLCESSKKYYYDLNLLKIIKAYLQLMIRVTVVSLQNFSRPSGRMGL
jgi:hypothetical protein